MPSQSLPLRDIHLPPAISWWPPAPGWWYLLAGVVILVGLALLIRRWYKKGALRREALTRLRQIETAYEQEGDCIKLSQELSILLRRIVLSNRPKEQVAGLTGENWLRFLDEHNPVSNKKNSSAFQQGAGRILITAPYQKQVDKEEVDRLLGLCQKWITKGRLH